MIKSISGNISNIEELVNVIVLSTYRLEMIKDWAIKINLDHLIL